MCINLKGSVSRVLKLKKGDTVAVYINVDNYECLNMKVALDNVDEWCFDGEVMSVGRKYITVKFKDMCKKFDINNYYRSLFKEGEESYSLCDSKEWIIEQILRVEILLELNEFFSKIDNNISLDKLRLIKQIIES
ncbi:hypothetical protein ACSW8S_15560 (plasmid) [Clostridium perfringens]